jgi:hypothetical protein
MKILRKYSAHKITCPYCKSLLEIKATDVNGDDCGVLHHHQGEDCWVNCEACGELIPLFSAKLPKEWLHEIFPTGC